MTEDIHVKVESRGLVCHNTNIQVVALVCAAAVAWVRLETRAVYASAPTSAIHVFSE